MTTASEWRVSYRREAWSSRTSTKSRLFHRRADLERFLEKITRGDRPELSPVSCRVERRSVGQWIEEVGEDE